MEITYCYLHLFVFFCLFSYSLQDDACRVLGCGEGKCVADNDNSLSYHCECNRGWKRMMVAPMPFSSCVVPNCSMSFPCGTGSPPPPPPPPSPPQPLFNITNVCNFVWCGEGDCVAEGRTHSCRCHADADNLINDNSMSICVKQCSFRADCNHLGIVTAKPPSWPLPPPPPTPSSANSLSSGTTMFAYRAAQLLFSSIVIAIT